MGIHRLNCWIKMVHHIPDVDSQKAGGQLIIVGFNLFLEIYPNTAAIDMY